MDGIKEALAKIKNGLIDGTLKKEKSNIQCWACMDAGVIEYTKRVDGFDYGYIAYCNCPAGDEFHFDGAGKLRDHGFSVTQATVSRDIKELRLIKVLTPEGRYRYATVEKAEADLQERFIRMFSNCVLSVTSAGNLIVIKTIAGSANAAAEAVDTLKWPDILGSIAGDNTIFIAVRDAKSVGDIIKKFQKMLK